MLFLSTQGRSGAYRRPRREGLQPHDRVVPSQQTAKTSTRHERGRMMDIRAAEISAILKDQIENFGNEADVAEVGQVLSVGDGVARIYGLDNVQAGEMRSEEHTSELQSLMRISYAVFCLKKKKKNKKPQPLVTHK